MSQQRNRQLLPILEKRLNLFPIVGVLGARQTGKSTLLRDFLPLYRQTNYVTMDLIEERHQALPQPTFYIQNLEDPSIKTVCIDEIQKVPHLFDTLKALVDQKKTPGRFAISGSTEFSKKTGINESLTGRIALLRLYPLNISETENLPSKFPLTTQQFDLNQKINPTQLKYMAQWMQKSGLPGIFSIREEANRALLYDAWIETSCTRDLAFFKIPQFNPDLARRILSLIVQLDYPCTSEIAKALGKSTRSTQNYLDALKALFILYEIEPHPKSSGKSKYYLFDAGLAHYLKASNIQKLRILF